MHPTICLNKHFLWPWKGSRLSSAPCEKQGFTLVELLVVFGVIAILAATLFPAAKRAFSASQAAQATGNIRQLLSAEMLYASEHDNLLTPIYGRPYGAGNALSWWTRLGPYVYPQLSGTNNDEVRRLRASRKTVFDVPGASIVVKNGVTMAQSVAMNWALFEHPSGGTSGFNLLKMPRRGSILMLGEINPAYVDSVIAPNISGNVEVAFRRPGDRAVIGFCDGHVESMTKEQLTTEGKTTSDNPWYWW